MDWNKFRNILVDKQWLLGDKTGLLNMTFKEKHSFSYKKLSIVGDLSHMETTYHNCFWLCVFIWY